MLCKISLSVSMEPAATSPQLAWLRSQPFGETMLAPSLPTASNWANSKRKRLKPATAWSKHILCWAVLRVFFANYLSKVFQSNYSFHHRVTYSPIWTIRWSIKHNKHYIRHKDIGRWQAGSDHCLAHTDKRKQARVWDMERHGPTFFRYVYNL